MIELRLIDAPQDRPPGYLEDVIAHGHIAGDTLLLDEDTYFDLCAKYRPAQIEAHFRDRGGGHLTELDRWIAAGRPLRSIQEFSALEAICGGCLDRVCAACRSTALGRWMTTWNCPLQLWHLTHPDTPIKQPLQRP